AALKRGPDGFLGFAFGPKSTELAQDIKWAGNLVAALEAQRDVQLPRQNEHQERRDREDDPGPVDARLAVCVRLQLVQTSLEVPEFIRVTLQGRRGDVAGHVGLLRHVLSLDKSRLLFNWHGGGSPRAGGG